MIDASRSAPGALPAAPRFFVAVIVACAIAACGGRRSPPPFDPTDATSVATLLRLPPELESRRNELAEAISNAHRLVTDFARAHGFADRIRGSFYRSAEVIPDQAALWERVLEINGLPRDTKLITDGLAAGIEGGVLVALPPEGYARVRPEYGQAPDAWVRLVAHEIAHRLHVVLVDGKEDAMGPQWFYEGFAVFAAGQPVREEPGFSSSSEALQAVHETKARGSYAVYGAAVRYFASRIPVADLVARAARPDFEDWLHDR